MTDTGARETIAARLWKEAKTFFWIVVYLFMVFGFYTLADATIQRREGLGFAPQGFALINALVFGKVILIGEQLRLGQWRHRGPLALTIALQSFVFTLLLLAFHILEHAAIGYFRHGSVTFRPDLGGGGWLGLAIVVVMVFLALIPFFTYRNLSRLLGPDRLRAILFSARSAE